MTRRLAALALLGVAALAFLAQATPTPLLTPAEAAAWEGQTVAMRGVVRDRRVSDGVARFDLVLEGHALAARSEKPIPLDGTPVALEGRLTRFNGVLTLLADRVAVHALDDPLRVSLSALAADPALWKDQAVTVHGTITQGHLHADGHRIALGTGAWPTTGPVQAVVLLSYDAACACHRLDRVAA